MFWFRVKCLKQGIINRNSVLKQGRKISDFVLNRPGRTSPPKDISSTPRGLSGPSMTLV